MQASLGIPRGAAKGSAWVGTQPLPHQGPGLLSMEFTPGTHKELAHQMESELQL